MVAASWRTLSPASGAVCEGPQCVAYTVIECVPKGGRPAEYDPVTFNTGEWAGRRVPGGRQRAAARGRLTPPAASAGCGNSGTSNLGHHNSGSNNMGSRNSGSNTYGECNTGSNVVGSGNEASNVFASYGSPWPWAL